MNTEHNQNTNDTANEVKGAQDAPTYPKFVSVLVARQSYDVMSNEYKLIPNIDVIARASSTKLVEGWELYQHFIEIADILNEDISSVVEDYNDEVEKFRDEDNNEVIDLTTLSIDFQSVFDTYTNSFLKPIVTNLRAGGYSQVNVYLEIHFGDEPNDVVTIQPDDIEAISRYS